MKPRHALLIVGILFFVGFVHNVVTGELTVGDTIAQWVAVILCGGGFLFLQREERARDALLAYLRENIEALRSGTAVYEGQTLSYATRVRVDTIVVSLLLASFKVNTRPMIVGSPGSGLRRAGYTVMTLVFGWWGIPWGPIWTLQALVNNARGTQTYALGELVEGKSTVVVPTAAARG